MRIGNSTETTGDVTHADGSRDVDYALYASADHSVPALAHLHVTYG